MKKQLNNTVIKNLTPEMGEKIIKKYQDDGWDTGELLGHSCELTEDSYIYYGVIDGIFDHYTLTEVQESNARIIELNHEPEFNPTTERKAELKKQIAEPQEEFNRLVDEV
jgi:hypothetical protein